MAERGHLPAQTGLKSLLYTASAGVLFFEMFGNSKGSEEKSTHASIGTERPRFAERGGGAPAEDGLGAAHRMRKHKAASGAPVTVQECFALRKAARREAAAK